MTHIPRHEPVERFDLIWAGWENSSPKGDRVAQRRVGRERFLKALESAVHRAPSPWVVEVGCGSAIDLCLLLTRFPCLAAVGLDISPVGVNVAKTFAQHLEVSLQLCCGDVFSLPFRSGSLGLVFSQGLLEHFREPDAAIEEQVRTLARGGYLIISVPQQYTGYTLHKHWAIRRGTWPWGWEGQFTARQLSRLGQRQGLQLLEVFGYQYWLSWLEPAWVLRDLWGKVQRRNPLATMPPFSTIARGYEALWGWLETRFGHLFLQNVVAVFQKPMGNP